MFARLLDDAAGYWSITATGATAIRRAYLPTSLVLRTEFTTATGVLMLTDALALGRGNPRPTGRHPGGLAVVVS